MGDEKLIIMSVAVRGINDNIRFYMEGGLQILVYRTRRRGGGDGHWLS